MPRWVICRGTPGSITRAIRGIDFDERREQWACCVPAKKARANPILEVRETIKDAYSSRSKFAHGNVLTHKDRRKFENKYKDLNKILTSILDYLRLGILVSFLVPISKEEFLDLIDDALIDNKKSTEL